MKVVVCDPIAEEALDILRTRDDLDLHVCESPPRKDALIALARDADALIVRSATRVDADVIAAGVGLRAIGRAGAGVDNVDLEAATRRGVVVMNAPSGNSVAAAEHTFSLILALARHIAQANRSLRSGKWERSKFTGVELAGKTLGVLGLGRVGREVARRALAFRMRVLAHDPHIPSQIARDLGAEPAERDEVLAAADFLTLHLPLTDSTRHLLDARAFSRMKAGVRIVNCARGGLIDEQALSEAIDSGTVAGAAVDVFDEEPPTERSLIDLEEVIATPHLGASTVEAQRRVGEEIVKKILAYLRTGLPADAVNFPAIPAEAAERLLPFMRLAERLGSFLAQIGPSAPRRLELRYAGDLASLDLRPLTMAAVKGILSPSTDEPVGYVNALSAAGERGLAISETTTREPAPFSNLIEMRLCGEGGEETSCGGTNLRPGEARLVSVDGIDIEASLGETCLFFRNRDLPGVVGAVGTMLGRGGVNIAAMGLGRPPAPGTAIGIVTVDSTIPPKVMEEIRRLPEIRFLRQVRL
jgi:D-3-phosphoglycerate dehydrogenase